MPISMEKTLNCQQIMPFRCLGRDETNNWHYYALCYGFINKNFIARYSTDGKKWALSKRGLKLSTWNLLRCSRRTSDTSVPRESPWQQEQRTWCSLHSSQNWPWRHFFFFLPPCAAYGILVSPPGIKHSPLHWKHRVLTNGPPGIPRTFLDVLKHVP